MSSKPNAHSYTLPPMAVPRKHPTDPPAAIMGTNNSNPNRPPLGDRPVGNPNVSASSSAPCKPQYEIVNKPPVHQQPHQHRFATPNHPQVKLASKPTHGTSFIQQHEGPTQNTPAMSEKVGAPFKSPVTLCFERMLGAGKSIVLE
jgi:hypothetical protein